MAMHYINMSMTYLTFRLTIHLEMLKVLVYPYLLKVDLTAIYMCPVTFLSLPTFKKKVMPENDTFRF